MADLITLARAKVAFPSITDNSQDASIATLITSTSKAVEKYCRRQFGLQAYDEVYDSDGTGSLLLRNFPVLAVSRLATNPQGVLSVRNTNAANSRALVGTQQATGDWPQPTTGLTLTRIANGVTVTDTSVLWATYPSVATVANAINALGNGWVASVMNNQGGWSSADITPLVGPLSCRLSPAQLNAHTTDTDSYDVIPETGEVRFTGGLATLFGAGWAPDSAGWVMPGVGLPRGGRNVRVQYTAGYSTIPEDLQMACALWVAYNYFDPVTVVGYSSEKYEDYRYTVQTREFDPPPAAKKILNLYKDHKV